MKHSGFTLVELLVVLAVMAILLAIVVPGYSQFMNFNRLVAATNDLVASLQLARSEAIKRGISVTVCKSANSGGATPACDALAGWNEGWLVFVDSGALGVIDANDQLLWAQGRLPQSVSINPGVAFNHFISYRPNGRSQGSSNFPNGTIKICVAGSRRNIIINNTGRPRLSSGSC